jgi:hypothetical protein
VEVLDEQILGERVQTITQPDCVYNATRGREKKSKVLFLFFYPNFTNKKHVYNFNICTGNTPKNIHNYKPCQSREERGSKTNKEHTDISHSIFLFAARQASP